MRGRWRDWIRRGAGDGRYESCVGSIPCQLCFLVRHGGGWRDGRGRFLSDAGAVGRGWAVSVGGSLRRIPAGGIFALLGFVLWPNRIVAMGGASDRAKGRVAEHPVHVCARRDSDCRAGPAKPGVCASIAACRRRRVGGRSKRDRASATDNPAASASSGNLVRGGFYADRNRSCDVDVAVVA